MEALVQTGEGKPLVEVLARIAVKRQEVALGKGVEGDMGSSYL